MRNFYLYLSYLFLLLSSSALGKIHQLSLKDDSRRNILLSKFGYNENGTFDFVLTNFTVPQEVIPLNNKEDKFNNIGFTLSRSNVIAEDIHSNPHVCQLEQQDQGIDALFFVFDFTDKQLIVTRSGSIVDIQLCPSADECPISSPTDTPPVTSSTEVSILAKLWSGNNHASGALYQNSIPLTVENGQYSMRFGIRFAQSQRGLYNLIYHNCFNYRAHGFSDRVAVDFTVSIVERNVNSYLSAGDIAKPNLYLYVSFLFALASILWINVLCRSDSKSVFRVHKLMTALILLKCLSLFCHGMNYYFVSVHGQQREAWAVIYYITHLLKGGLLFGTVILIGTGYTFFKNFLSNRDRNLFLIVLPLQTLDNVALIILEESEFGEQRYYFWFEIFVFLDLVCCMAILFPIIWSMRHLAEGARTDGKAAFNLQRLLLFRHFYVLVIGYIYLTRIVKFIIELSTLFFFVMVGSKFRPAKSNPYLRLAQDDSDDVESAMALTSNGLYENVSRVQRISVQEELNDIPGGIGSGSEDEDDDTLLPKTDKNSLTL
ncbi:lung seven transmembrane receptor domain-containing protein [Ditylenchus destructor]|uniref:Lung seven transmembrane receptor domain-containing protein n=1 Tax=Ditylenchus destructor TaxID=166010 RepID=A0AAD4NA55_9BILA|nr:lung seven transmembrane receptor domain-containing protein [Ditylenchus destructor]